MLVRRDIVDWAARIGGIGSISTSATLPHNLKGRSMHAIAVFRSSATGSPPASCHDPVLGEGLMGAFRDRTYFVQGSSPRSGR